MAVDFMTTTKLNVDLIRLDGGTQIRAELNQARIEELAELLREGHAFKDPIVVFYDGTDYYAGDGFHRTVATIKAEMTTIEADVRSGTREDAIEFACGANAEHGLPRNNQDKRNAVLRLLDLSKWQIRSNREIARQCRVTEGLVRLIRNGLPEEHPSAYNTQMTRTVERNGTEYTIVLPTNNLHEPQSEIPLLPFQELARQELVQEEDEEIEETEEDRYMQAVDIGALDYYHDDLRREAIARDKEQRDTHVMRVMGSSDSPEWYTPTWIVEKVLELMGTIDLDPCSNSHEEPNVPASVLYTKEDDGLKRVWHGKVYLNPPYGTVIGEWTNRLISTYKSGDVEEAIALLPGRIDTNWFSPLYEYLICIIKGRVQFENSPYHAPFPCVLVYLGNRRDEFTKVFSSLGPIVERIA